MLKFLKFSKNFSKNIKKHEIQRKFRKNAINIQKIRKIPKIKKNLRKSPKNTKNAEFNGNPEKNSCCAKQLDVKIVEGLGNATTDLWQR